jgi:pyridine nucleotide-disulfide oxidoreductase domain-containing protein 1
MRATDDKHESLLESFDVTNLSMEELENIVGPPLRCIHGICTFIDAARKVVTVFHPISNSTSVISFDNVCICSGSSPSSSEISSSLGGHPQIVSIRDSDSVDKLASRLASARRAVLVGNGGIALGLAHEAPKAAPTCQLVWAIRGNSLGTNFFDSSASLFLLESRIEPLNTPRIVYANDPMNSLDARGLLEKTLSSAESSHHHIYTASQIDDSRTLTSIFRHDSDRRKRSPEAPMTVLDSQSPLPPRPSLSKRSRRGYNSESNERPLIIEEKEIESSESFVHLSEEDVRKHKHFDKTFGSSMGPAWVQSLHSHKAAQNHPDASVRGKVPIILETSVEVEALMGSGVEGRVGGLADGRWHSIKTCSSELNESNDELKEKVPLNEEKWPIFVKLTNGRVYGCDLVISATGAVPVTSMLPLPLSSVPSDIQPAEGAFHRNVDGGLIVNDLMQTTGSPYVYAAGDAASVLWPRAAALKSNQDRGFQSVLEKGAKVPLWFQMRLWSQARMQGEYAARCMLQRRDSLESEDEGDDVAGGLAFDLFAHSTFFLGFKVILLGLYNGQGLGSAYEHALRSQLVATSTGLERIDQAQKEKAAQLIGESASVQVQLRITPGKEYIKIIILHGRVVGALLVGDTDLEETLEHLIMNRLDLRQGEDGSILDLLNPDIDIEDYFD